MDEQALLEHFSKYTENEAFYKEYYEAKKDKKQFDMFLHTIVSSRPLKYSQWLPELHMAGADYISELYIEDNSANVSFIKHERYTPLFLHEHAFFEMIYVFSGSCENTIEGTPIHMKQHDICIIAPGVSHTLGVFDDESIIINVIIRKSTFKEVFFDIFTDDAALSLFFSHILYAKDSNSYIFFATQGNALLHSTINLFLTEGIIQEQYSVKAMENLLRTIFCQLLRSHEAIVSKKAVAQSSEIYKILRYIQNHYKDVTLNELAEQFNYSPTYIGNMIKRQTGTSFIKIVRDIRLTKACAMLRETNLQINEICYQVGYESTEFFIRTFKQTYQCTPGEYRRQAAGIVKDKSNYLQN